MVAFHGRIGEEEGIYVISANGGKPQLITNEKSHFRYARTYNLMPAWSPDNKWIYFRSKRSGESQIWKKRSDGTGEAIQITKGGGFRASPLPDGKTIFYTKSADAKEMWRTPAKGGKEELVPEFAKAGFEQGLHWTMTKESIYFFVRETDKGFNIKLYDFATQQIEQIDGNYNIPANLNLRDGMTTNGKIFLFTVQDPLVSYIMLADLPQ